MPTDKEIADNIVQLTQVLNQQLKHAHAAGLSVDLHESSYSRKEPDYYEVRIYRRQPDEVIGESPKRK
jgi:hypothetical protein